ncbi:MAG: LysM peptidoglycan-binding domain-containing protein, partial [Bacteroidetes bacterium]
HKVSDHYEKRTYIVLAGDNIHKLARMFHCSVTDIMQWNNLRTSELFYRQELIIYRPKSGGFYRRA